MRVTSGPLTHRRHKKVLRRAKGFRNGRKNLFKRGNESIISALRHAYRDRKHKKSEYRALWIARINAAVRELDRSFSYSRFMNGLRNANVEINRKVLADLAVHNEEEFSRLVALAKDNL